ncbi:MAG: nuclear transport factor 2 family protein [Acidimicrobiia bacterium]
MAPEDVVRLLFARVRAGDPSAGDLYASDAFLHTPSGRHDGRDAITDFYRGVTRGGRTQPEIEALYAAPPLVVALLSVTVGEAEVVRVVDVFEVQDGAIQSLRVCSFLD